jgi:uncharacterized membrane protein YjfL (UPF0719 family)
MIQTTRAISLVLVSSASVLAGYHSMKPVLGFKIFDWLMPRINIEKELAENHNIAVAIVVAAMIIGLSMIIAAVMGAPAM